MKELNNHNFSPNVGQSQAICVTLIFQLLPKVTAPPVVIVTKMGSVPLTAKYICCPEFSPHIIGGLEPDPVMTIESNTQFPLPSGCAKIRLRKSNLT